MRTGIEITLYSFGYHIGSLGPIFITATIALFALATVIAGYYYGESSLKFIKNASKTDIIILKLITMISVVIGSVMSSSLLWTIVNVLVGIIAIINMYAIFVLKDIIIEEYRKT